MTSNLTCFTSQTASVLRFTKKVRDFENKLGFFLLPVCSHARIGKETAGVFFVFFCGFSGSDETPALSLPTSVRTYASYIKVSVAPALPAHTETSCIVPTGPSSLPRA